jgi:epoxyqueuosine reductase
MLSKEELENFGIIDWGYTEVSEPINYQKFRDWISQNNYGPLDYLADNRADIRKDIKNYFPQYQSALVFLFSYQTANQFLNQFYNSAKSNGLKIASYTLGFEGFDYHLIINKRLEEIAQKIKLEYGDCEFKLAIDVHPVLDRDLAFSAGLGFYGKNSMFINKSAGSFTIIGSLLFDRKFDFEKKKIDTDHCGQCTRCIDACPTDAIMKDDRTINTSRCISTFTIEQFKIDTVPDPKLNLSSGFIFGCDICQDVCPWNQRIVRKNPVIDYYISEKMQEMFNFFLTDHPTQILEKIKLLSNNQFKKVFLNTSFYRSGKRGILKNFQKLFIDRRF